MKDIYSQEGSEYFKLKSDWDVGDSAWKAKFAYDLLVKNNIYPESIVEVGCGVGEVLLNIEKNFEDSSIKYSGYDIAIDAINIAKSKETENVKYYRDDLTKLDSFFDVLLMVDVFEHVPDYIGFIEKCAKRAKYKVYHIPLDIHISSLLRGKMIDARNEVGHLHYYTKETALATLVDTEQKIIDYCYTDGTMQTPKKSFKMKLANLARTAMYSVAPDLTVKLFGGYSLMVLTEGHETGD